MTNIPAQFKTPAQPQVNLLPPEVGERRRTSRRRGAAVALFVLFLMVVGALYAFIWLGKEAAIAEADKEEKRTAELQAQIESYSEVDIVKAQLSNAESARQYAAAVEVFWPLLVASLNGALPENVDASEWVISMPSFGQSPLPPESPFNREGVGRVTFNIRLSDPINAADVEESLNRIPFLQDARASVVTASAGQDAEGGVTGPSGWVLDGAVSINYDVLMQRYSPLWFGTDGADSLEEYYEDYYSRLLAGNGVPPGYPPLPPATPPVLIPGQSAVEPQPQPEPSPSEELES